jgi:hypothetical protein
MNGGRLRVPFQVVRIKGHQLIVKFDSAPAVRRALIARLFGGDYAKDLESVSVARVLSIMATRLLG